ncbi:MAG: metalloregulator ArsR/SmtB family transcription factor [Acidimicrobiia bacterium]
MVGDPQRLLDALASPIRREILWLVRDRELAAGDIAAAFEVTAPTISQHLAVLRDSELVEMRVDGSFRRYRARTDMLRGLEALIASDDRWLVASDLPETELAATSVELVVRVSVDVPATQEVVFECFADPASYSRWLGVPVSLVDGRFACTMEWGTRVRGTYDVVVPPSLIAMRWDFEDDNIPVPGNERVAYLRITASDAGTRAEVHQIVADEREAEFMKVAWSMVLGRMKQSFVDARAARRPRRSKRTNEV